MVTKDNNISLRLPRTGHWRSCRPGSPRPRPFTRKRPNFPARLASLSWLPWLPSFPCAGEDRCRRRRGDAAGLYSPFLSFYLPGWIAPGRLPCRVAFLGRKWLGLIHGKTAGNGEACGGGGRPAGGLDNGDGDLTMNLPVTWQRSVETVVREWGRLDFARGITPSPRRFTQIPRLAGSRLIIRLVLHVACSPGLSLC